MWWLVQDATRHGNELLLKVLDQVSFTAADFMARPQGGEYHDNSLEILVSNAATGGKPLFSDAAKDYVSTLDRVLDKVTFTADDFTDRPKGIGKISTTALQRLAYAATNGHRSKALMEAVKKYFFTATHFNEREKSNGFSAVPSAREILTEEACRRGAPMALQEIRSTFMAKFRGESSIKFW